MKEASGMGGMVRHEAQQSTPEDKAG